MHSLFLTAAVLVARVAAASLGVQEILNCPRSSVLISPPHNVPQNASPPIKPYFPGFAFEEASFYYYAGTFSVSCSDVNLGIYQLGDR
jgi:hypothetical protein